MMIRVWDVSVTPEQYSYFIEEGVLDYRTPFAIEVTSEELEMLESMVEKVDKPGWWGCSCVYKRALALFLWEVWFLGHSLTAAQRRFWEFKKKMYKNSTPLLVVYQYF